MDFPVLSEAFRLGQLCPPSGKVRMVLDTDTYNEIDDQFALVHALLSPQNMAVEAIYAAPFHNNRSINAGDGMEKSHAEILRLLERLDVLPAGLVHRGSHEFLATEDQAITSNAATDLVQRAMTSSEPLYVVAIGAVTNIASALLLEPRLVEKIVVVWLGGQAHHAPTAHEFNLSQDVYASRLLFDCGVPLVQIPCQGVASHLLSTVAELERFVQGRGAIGDYLVEIFKAYHNDHFAWSKVIWDIAATAYLINPAWVPTQVVHSPLLTDQCTWSTDHRRHFIRVATHIQRDPIFKDFFQKLDQRSVPN